MCCNLTEEQKRKVLADYAVYSHEFYMALASKMNKDK